MGWGQLGFQGGKQVPTPNIDRLAREGVSLTQFYVHSVCTPDPRGPAHRPLPRPHRRRRAVPRQRHRRHAHRRAHAGRRAQGGRLLHRHLRQVAPRRVAQEAPAHAARLRAPVRLLRRRHPPLHQDPRRRLRLAPQRAARPRARRLHHVPDRRRVQARPRPPRREQAVLLLRPLQRRARPPRRAAGVHQEAQRRPPARDAGVHGRRRRPDARRAAREGRAGQDAGHLLQRQRRPAARHERAVQGHQGHRLRGRRPRPVRDALAGKDQPPAPPWTR